MRFNATRLHRMTIAVLLGAFLLTPMLPVYAQSSTGVPIPVTGTFTDAAGGVGRFVGSLSLKRFAVQDNQIVAVGTLTGTLTDSLGAVVGTVLRNLTMALTNTQASCQILHLELGPLDLNLLGLVVHLDKIVLDIDAESGSGNLLGNLLCAVAHLLDSNAAPQALSNMLNRILGLLG